MNCPNCFTLCPDGQTVCGDCGRPLPISQLETPPTYEVPVGHDPGCPCMPCYFAGLEGDIANV